MHGRMARLTSFAVACAAHRYSHSPAFISGHVSREQCSWRVRTKGWDRSFARRLAVDVLALVYEDTRRDS